MPRPKVDMQGIEDRWSDPERHGKGKRYRIRLRGIPGHAGAVVEMFDDLDQAIDRRNELLAKRSDPTVVKVEAGRVSLAAIGKAYADSLRANPFPPTPHYIHTVEEVVRRAVAANLDDVRREDWADAAQAWLTTLIAKRHRQIDTKPASEATKRMYRAILGGALNYAVDVLEVLHTNPFRKLQIRRTKAKRLHLQASRTESDAHKLIPVPILTRIVSEDARWRTDERRAQAEAAVARHDGDKLAAAKDLGVSLATIYNRLERTGRVEDPRWLMAVLMAYTGMRLGQTVGLTWADVDIKARTLRLRGEVVGNRSGHDVTIEMEDELHEILAKTLPTGAFVVPDPVEANPKRKTTRPIRRAWLAESFGRWLEEHGAGAYTAHDFRHSFVCMLTAMGVPSADVRRRVNHADVAMTSRYADHMLVIYRAACAGWNGKIRLRTILLGQADDTECAIVGNAEAAQWTSNPG